MTTRTAAATREALGPTLARLVREGLDIVVVDADLGSSTTARQFGREFPERFVTVGVAEQNMVNVAAGLAAAGKTVFISTFAAFAPGYGLGFLGLYALALLASAVWPAVRRKRLALVLAIPVVLAIEHVCYAFGFWKGLVLAHGGPKRRSAETQRESA